MMELNWRPQESFKDFFLHTKEDLIKHRSVFNPEIEYFIPYGGRGSAKTWSFVDACVIEATLRPVRILVAREIQGSIEESIKAEIEAAIDSRNLNHFFDVQKTCINGANGSRFIFKGLKNNIKSLKSIADVDIVLCEEAEDITKLSWDKLLPSIRPRDQITREGMPIVIVIFNPNQLLDDTYQRFVVTPPPNSIPKLLNFPDNIFFPAHLERQRLHFQKTRPLKDYEHEWLGKPKGAGDNAIIDIDWITAARFASGNPLFRKAGKRRVGYDPAGQGNDSHAVIYIDGNVLIEVDEWLLSSDMRVATKRAFTMALKHKVDQFDYDECGGFGDGVSVFVADEKAAHPSATLHMKINPFNAGDGVFDEGQIIPGTEKTWEEEYSNAKAQAWGITAQQLYNTYRFIVLGETDQEPEDLCSIDIIDDEVFNKLAKELSTPLWVKSGVNSKKKVEAKKDMEKRIGQKSPNLGDAYVMTRSKAKLVMGAACF